MFEENTSKVKSAALIGGGFYACYLAWELANAGVEVDLFEREPELMTRASYRNQARVHGGYHARHVHAHPAERQSGLVASKEIMSLRVAVPNDHQNLICRSCLRFQGRETPAQILRAAVSWDQDGDTHSGRVCKASS